MTTNRKYAITNLLLSIALFFTYVLLMNLQRGELGKIIEMLQLGAGLPEAINGAFLVLGAIYLYLCSAALLFNIIIKALQVGFDKWWLSLPSVPITVFMMFWTGLYTIATLASEFGFKAIVCLAMLAVEIALVVIDCKAISARPRSGEAAADEA